MAKILLVDDTEANRDMLTRRLQKRGFEVVTAVNGQEACQMAVDDRPDLILMDIQMPVMNGYDATRQIKASPVTKSIPIIGLTAHAMAGDRQKVLEAGCDDYQAKPINFSELLETISRLLDTTSAS